MNTDIHKNLLKLGLLNQIKLPYIRNIKSKSRALFEKSESGKPGSKQHPNLLITLSR